MSLSQPRIVFGIHSFTAINKSTAKPYGIAKVLANSSLTITSEKIDLYGGSLMAAWATENTNTTYEIALQFKQIEDWMFEVFLGAGVTASPQSTGSIKPLQNVQGNLVQATTGVASVQVISGSEADLKYGRYAIVAKSATTVDIYGSTDIDFGRGTKKDFLDDSLKIAENITVSDTGGETTIAGFGFKIVGGSGTVALTTADSAVFEVISGNSGSSEIIVGAQEAQLPEFEALIVAQRRATKEMFSVLCHKVQGAGLPLGFTEKDYAQPEVSATALYDQTKNRVATIHAIKST